MIKRKKMQPIKENGGWIYQGQPPETRIANLDDFYEEGKIIIGKPYLIHSELHPERFEAHRTRPGFTEANDFMLFLERGRIYVFEKKGE